MTLELAADGPWVKRGHGPARIEPGARPAGLVVSSTASDEVVAYLENGREPAAARG